MIDRDLRVERVPLAQIKPYEGNAKIHTSKQIDAVEASIKEFGFSNPVLLWRNEDGAPEIVAGHARCKAAQNLGMQEVPAIFLDDLSDTQRRALTLADNQTAMMTGWDMDQLAYELDSLEDVFDMEDFGFDPLSMADMRTSEGESLLSTESLSDYVANADAQLKSFNVTICCLDQEQMDYVAGLLGVDNLKRIYRAKELM